MQIKNIESLSISVITNEIPKYDPKLPIEWDQRFPEVLSDLERMKPYLNWPDGETEQVNYSDFYSL